MGRRFHATGRKKPALNNVFPHPMIHPSFPLLLVLACLLAQVSDLEARGPVREEALFESRAEMMVKIVVERNEIDPAPMNEKRREFTLKAQRENLKSAELATRVAGVILNSKPHNLGDGEKFEAAKINLAESIRRNLHVSFSPRPHVLVLAYRSPDPVTARATLDTVVKECVQKNLEIQQNKREIELLQAEVGEERLALQDRKAAHLKLKENPASTDEQLAESKRKLKRAEKNYRQVSRALEEARLDAVLGRGGALNISVIQAPSKAVRVPK